MAGGARARQSHRDLIGFRMRLGALNPDASAGRHAMTCARTTLLLLFPVALCVVASSAAVVPGHPAKVVQEAASRQASTQPAVERSTAVLLLQNPPPAGRPGGLDIRTVGEIMTST